MNHLDWKRNMLVCQRTLMTNSGNWIVYISKSEDLNSSGESFTYHINDAEGKLVSSAMLHGEDSVQAILFCLTAAGDYISRFAPEASFAGLGAACLPVTDLEAKKEWRASLRIPTN